MIRTAEESDRGDVFAIWKTCFGDPDTYIRFFMERQFKPSRCLLYIADGKPAAMLHLLPMTYQEGLSRMHAQYVYAAATLPDFRRKGIMAELLEDVRARNSVNGYAFTALLPAGDALYSYYEKCGFKTVFSLKIKQLKRQDFAANASDVQPLQEAPAAFDRMLAQRKKIMNPGLLWEANEFAYVLEEWKLSGGEILAFQEGYCLCRREQSHIFVKECCVPEAFVASAIAAVFQKYGESLLKICLSPQSHAFPEAAVIRNGMCSTDAVVSAGTYFHMLLD